MYLWSRVKNEAVNGMVCNSTGVCGPLTSVEGAFSLVEIINDVIITLLLGHCQLKMLQYDIS